MSNYPETVTEVLQPAMQFPAGVIDALQRFAVACPWSGTTDERFQKFRTLSAALSHECDIPEPELVIKQIDGGSSGRSYYLPQRHRIVLVGKLSVVTLLHELAHACGLGERDACAWSINLFRQVFPRQYSRLIHQGHMLIRVRDAPVVRRNGDATEKAQRQPSGLADPGQSAH
jgi:hypothetical protein